MVDVFKGKMEQNIMMKKVWDLQFVILEADGRKIICQLWLLYNFQDEGLEVDV